MSNAGELFEELINVIHKLRDPKSGCPWDKEQTHASLKPYLIEESYETLDAIDNHPEKLGEELGDVLLQVMLHSEIASETGAFDAAKVVDNITKKLISRHPHVFGEVKVEGTAEVLKNWEQIKQKSLKEGESILDGIPKGMPALLRAHRTGEKVAGVGFEWEKTEEVKDKVFEELREFLEVSLDPKESRDRLEDEYGDILFSLTQLARRLKFNSEDLLQRATDKFSRRFREVEKRAGPQLKEKTVKELDAIWENVKEEERATRSS